MSRAEFTGFLDGEKLSEAYANMDVFVFPSETDAFGNVAQEANASGVPALVTAQGGPKFIVKHGVSGFIAANSWDSVIEAVYDAYCEAIGLAEKQKAQKTPQADLKLNEGKN